MNSNQVSLGNRFRNLTGKELFFRVGPEHWRGSKFLAEDEVCLLTIAGVEATGAVPLNPLAMFIEAEVGRVGEVNTFQMVRPTRSEDWRALRAEAEALREARVLGVPYPCKRNSGILYIVPRRVALALCMHYDQEEAVANLVVPVRDRGRQDKENPQAFHGFLSGDQLFQGLKAIAQVR